MRSFVALIAFCARYAVGVRPVLMVDEAETHLHYGGQADLVRVFERQQVAETVIYTTHSIGCLPSDLGATIRVVSPIMGQPYRSRIHNSFWSAHGGAGLTPMILAMGANAFASTPSRRPVIGEAASQAILLPSLLREEDAEALEMEAWRRRVSRRRGCSRAGAPAQASERAKQEGRVIDVGTHSDDAQCIEDFVSADVLAQALNRLLARASSRLVRGRTRS